MLLTALALVVAPAPVAPAAASPGSDDLRVWVTDRFSPNDDGRMDEAVVRYRLPQAGRVAIVLEHPRHKSSRIVRLGKQSAGRHHWRWDGRGRGGKALPDRWYDITVKLTTPDGTVLSSTGHTVLDTSIHAEVWPRRSWSLPYDEVQAVFPRTEMVRDSVALRPILREEVSWAELIIKDAAGRTVLRRDVTDSKDNGGYSSPDRGPHPYDVAWTARLRGEALPPGRYRALIRAKDLVGNVGIARAGALRLWVSQDALAWREETRVVTPADSVRHPCGFTSWGNGCGEGPSSCGKVVPSTIFPGGHSYGSRECGDDPSRHVAEGMHYLPVPEAAGVRGVAAARVGFTGRPTTEGEIDAGTLRVYHEESVPPVDVTSSTEAATDWIECPSMCRGDYLEDVPGGPMSITPGVLWHFGTSGTDSVDVASFTVTVRYLAVPD